MSDSLSQNDISKFIRSFLASLTILGFKLTLQDYRSIELILQTKEQWSREELRDVLRAILVKNPEQERLFFFEFDSYLLPKVNTNFEEIVGQKGKGKRRVQPEEGQTRGKKIGAVLLIFIIISLVCFFAYRTENGRLQVRWMEFVAGIISKIPSVNPDKPIPTPTVTPPPSPIEPISVRVYKDFTKGRISDSDKPPIQPEKILVLVFLFLGSRLYLFWHLLRKVDREKIINIENPFKDWIVGNETEIPVFKPQNIGGLLEPFLDKKYLDKISKYFSYISDEEVSQEIDLSSTVDLIAHNGFFLDVVYKKYQQPQGVVILRDAYAEEWNPIAEELAKGLALRNVPVVYGRFYNKLSKIELVDNQTVLLNYSNWFTYSVEKSLEDIAEYKDNFIILVFSNGQHLAPNLEKENLKWLSQLPKIAWLELREPRFWDSGTRLPKQLKLPVYPANSQTLIEIFSYFFIKQQPLEPYRLNSNHQNVTSYIGQYEDEKGNIESGFASYLQRFLGDSISWARACSMLQPLSLSMADKLRREFFSHLPPQRLERLINLPNTSETIEGLVFSDPVRKALRHGFKNYFDYQRQEAILRYILKYVENVKPTEKLDNKPSLAYLSWKAMRELLRINIKAEEGSAKKELEFLLATPLGSFIKQEFADKKETISEPSYGYSAIPLKWWDELVIERFFKKLPKLPLAFSAACLIGIISLIAYANLQEKYFLEVTPNLEVQSIHLFSSEGNSKFESGIFLSWSPTYLEKNREYEIVLVYRDGNLEKLPKFSATTSKTLSFVISDDTKKCIERVEDAGFVIQRCPDEITKEEFLLEPWKNSAAGKINKNIIRSVGLEITSNQSGSDSSMKELRNKLLNTGSLDVIYLTSDRSNLIKTLQKIKTDYEYIPGITQLIWWSDNDYSETDNRIVNNVFPTNLWLGKIDVDGMKEFNRILALNPSDKVLYDENLIESNLKSKKNGKESINLVKEVPLIARDDEIEIYINGEKDIKELFDNDQYDSNLVIGVKITSLPKNGNLKPISGSQSNTFHSLDLFFYTYKPNVSFSGTDTFTYTLRDKYGQEVEAKVNIKVKLKTKDHEIAIIAGRSVEVDLLSNIIGIKVGDKVALGIAPTKGTASVLNGRVTYSSGDVLGNDSFTYFIERNGEEISDTGRITVQINPANQPTPTPTPITTPTATITPRPTTTPTQPIPTVTPAIGPILVSDDNGTIKENSTLTLDIFANDNWNNNQNLSFQLITQPTHGRVVYPNLNVNGRNGQITYTPNQDYSGSDTFEYKISSSSSGQFSTGRVNITIMPIRYEVSVKLISIDVKNDGDDDKSYWTFNISRNNVPSVSINEFDDDNSPYTINSPRNIDLFSGLNNQERIIIEKTDSIAIRISGKNIKDNITYEIMGTNPISFTELLQRTNLRGVLPNLIRGVGLINQPSIVFSVSVTPATDQEGKFIANQTPQGRRKEGKGEFTFNFTISQPREIN